MGFKKGDKVIVVSLQNTKARVNVNNRMEAGPKVLTIKTINSYGKGNHLMNDGWTYNWKDLRPMSNNVEMDYDESLWI